MTQSLSGKSIWCTVRCWEYPQKPFPNFPVNFKQAEERALLAYWGVDGTSIGSISSSISSVSSAILGISSSVSSAYGASGVGSSGGASGGGGGGAG